MDVREEFRRRIQDFLDDSSTIQMPPLPTNSAESELLSQCLSIKKSGLELNGMILRNESEVIAAKASDSAAKASDSAARKCDSDRFLYPIFIGSGLLAVTFGALNMGMGTNKAFELISTEIQGLTGFISQATSEITNAIITGTKVIGASAATSTLAYLSSFLSKRK